MNHNTIGWFNYKTTVVFIAYVENFDYLTGSFYENNILEI